MALLHDFLRTLEFSLAFQVEKVVIESILEPLEVMSIKNGILRLQSEHGEEAYASFRYFAETLAKSPQELLSRDNRRRDARQQIGVPCSNLSQQLDEIATAYFIKQIQAQPFALTLPVFCLSYHLVVTSTRIPDEPFSDQSNSVIRYFGHHDCFLRVSFHDEASKRPKLRRDARFNISQLLNSRYRGLLIDAVVVFQLINMRPRLMGIFLREFFGASPEPAINEGWDGDDEGADRRVKFEALKRAWAAWNVAENALNNDPTAFGPSSFRIVAVSTILGIIKKLRALQGGCRRF